MIMLTVCISGHLSWGGCAHEDSRVSGCMGNAWQLLDEFAARLCKCGSLMEETHGLLQGELHRGLQQNLVACCTLHQTGMPEATIQHVCTSRLC